MHTKRRIVHCGLVGCEGNKNRDPKHWKATNVQDPAETLGATLKVSGVQGHVSVS